MEYPEALKQRVLKQAEGQALTGFVTGQGNPHAKLMLVGEAPGRVEVETLIPFSGQSGRKLDEWLKLAGLSRQDIYITSAVRSRPFKTVRRVNRKGLEEVVYPNRTPNQLEIKLHAPLLDYDISHVKPKVLAPMGNIGLQRLLGKKYRISTCHGELIKAPIQEYSEEAQEFQLSEESYWLFPVYHPAAVLYNHRLEEPIQKDWLTLGKLING